MIVTLLYVRRVDVQVEATRRSAEAAEKTARANEQRARILEHQERGATLSRLQYIIEQSYDLSVECMRHYQRIAEWTMSDDEELPLVPPLFEDSHMKNLEATGSRVGGCVGGTVAEAVQSLESARHLLKTAEADLQHASNPKTAKIMENLKATLNSARTACFEAGTEAHKQIQFLRNELTTRASDQPEERTP